MNLCRCGHIELVHTLNPKNVRTFCTHGEAPGPCGCKRYEAS